MARGAGGPGYERYLLPGERVVVALHRHWAMVARPVGAWVAGLVVATWVDLMTPVGAKSVSTFVWWLWLALTLWAVWQVVDWRREWFVATDKRLVLTSGIFTRNVAMMPLGKVTDLSYVRTLPGQVVGYGMFVLESAGQDQALREVSWIPHPDATYRAICAEIFATPDEDATLRAETPEGVDDGWSSEWLTPQPYEAEGAASPKGPRPSPSPIVEHGTFSRGMPVTPRLSRRERRRQGESSDPSHQLYEPWQPWQPWEPVSSSEGEEHPDADGESPFTSTDDVHQQHGDDTGPVPRYDD